MLTNCILPIGNDVIERWFTAKKDEVPQTAGGKILKQIAICPIVKWYREFMGAVDRFDQFRAYLKLEMRTGKFWHVLFWFIIESALVNAFLLYKITRLFAGLEIEYTHLQFRVAVVLALVAEWEGMGCAFDSSMNSPATDLTNKSAKQIRVKFGRNLATRFSGDLHLRYMEDIPLKTGSKLKFRQLRCVNPGCKKARTSKWCRQCVAPLCFPQCFKEYHTLEELAHVSP